MKVVKKGRKKNGLPARYRCTGAGNGGGGCGIVHLIFKDDLFTTISSAGRKGAYCNTFTCICCDVETDIKDALLSTNELPLRNTWVQKRRNKTKGGTRGY